MFGARHVAQVENGCKGAEDLSDLRLRKAWWIGGQPADWKLKDSLRIGSHGGSYTALLWPGGSQSSEMSCHVDIRQNLNTIGRISTPSVLASIRLGHRRGGRRVHDSATGIESSACTHS